MNNNGACECRLCTSDLSDSLALKRLTWPGMLDIALATLDDTKGVTREELVSWFSTHLTSTFGRSMPSDLSNMIAITLSHHTSAFAKHSSPTGSWVRIGRAHPQLTPWTSLPSYLGSRDFTRTVGRHTAGVGKRTRSTRRALKRSRSPVAAVREIATKTAAGAGGTPPLDDDDSLSVRSSIESDIDSLLNGDVSATGDASTSWSSTTPPSNFHDSRHSIDDGVGAYATHQSNVRAWPHAVAMTDNADDDDVSTPRRMLDAFGTSPMSLRASSTDDAPSSRSFAAALEPLQSDTISPFDLMPISSVSLYSGDLMDYAYRRPARLPLADIDE